MNILMKQILILILILSCVHIVKGSNEVSFSQENDFYFTLGLSAMVSQNYDIAEKMFKKSYIEKENNSTLLFLANTYFLQKKYNLAKQCYEEIFNKYFEEYSLEGKKFIKFLYAENCLFLEDYLTAEKVYSEIEDVEDLKLRPLILYGKIFAQFKIEKYNSVLTNIALLKQYIKEKKCYLPYEIEEQLAYILAESWYKKSCFKDAEREFKKFVSIYKNSEYLPYANLRLVEIFNEQKKYASSEAMLKDIPLQKVSKDVEIVIKYNLARMLLKQAKYSSAIKLYKQLLTTVQDEILISQIKFDLGFCYFKTKDYTGCIEILSSLKCDEPKLIANSLYLLGLCHYNLENYNKVIEIFTKLISKYGRKYNLSTDVNYWLALSYMNTENYDNAISLFKNIVKEKSSIYSIPSEFFIARCYRKIKEYEIAKKILTSLLEKSSAQKLKLYILLELAECYKSTFDLEIAQQYYTQALENYKDTRIENSDIELSLAEVYIRTAKYEEAEKLINKVLSTTKNSKTKNSAEMLSFVLNYNKKNYDEVKKIAERLLTNEISKDEKKFILSSLARVYSIEGNYNEAIKYLTLWSSITEDMDKKFLIEQKILNLLYTSKKFDEIIKRCDNILSVYKKTSQKMVAIYYLLKVYSELNDERKIKHYSKRLKEIKDDTMLTFLSKEEIFNTFNILLSYDMDTAIDVAEIIIKSEMLYPKEIIEIVNKIIEIPVVSNRTESLLRLVSIIKQKFSDNYVSAYSEYLVGKIYEFNQKFSIAENVYKKIIEKYPQVELLAKVYISLLKIYTSQNRLELVSEIENILVTKYISLPEVGRYFYDTAVKFQTQKNFNEAIKRYAYVTNSQDVELQAMAQKKLGDCYYNLGKYKEASVEYLKTIYMYPQYTQLCAEAQFMVGLCCEQMKLYDEAKKAYTNSIKNYPGTLWAEESAFKLKNLK